MSSFHIPRSTVNWSWNRAHPPAIRVRPQDVIVLEVANASGGQLSEHSTVDDVASLDFARVNPVTGPVYVEGAEPGDALIVDVLSIDLDDWGWTAIIPGFGLLSEQFSAPHLRISRVTQAYAELIPGLRVPVCPFIGTIGLAPAQAGDHPLVPPSPQGGNMDTRQITAGSRLWLPVAVPGALLSVGDTHAAQGDGEVAGTAIETSAVVTLRVHVKKGVSLNTPRIATHAASQRQGSAWVTTGIGPDLFEAARQATESMMAWIQEMSGLSAADAYLLASVAADLKISEVVDAPNWVVTMHLSKEILRGGLG